MGIADAFPPYFSRSCGAIDEHHDQGDEDDWEDFMASIAQRVDECPVETQ
jgi:hypothetical protein